MTLAATAGRPRSRRAATRRLGFSLLELLIAMLISLMVLGATVSLFGVVAERIAGGRATIEINDRLRNASQLLRGDLRGLTIETTAWPSASSGNGYLELDKSPPTPAAQSFNGLLGYTDDILCFTTHSQGRPFTARVMLGGKTQIVESNYAEVQWFLYPRGPSPANTPPGTLPMRTLYRHMLLIRPDFPPISPNDYFTIDPQKPWEGTLNYDLSTRPDVNANPMVYVTNSLADLAYREFRFNHVIYSYPYSLASGFPGPVPADNIRYGEDVVLTNVINFDVKIWDPTAEVKHDVPDNRPLVPSDPGYSSGVSYSTKVLGAFVDLNYANLAGQSYFSGPTYGDGNKSALAGTQPSQGSYDTWCSGYEFYNHSAYSWWSNPATDVLYGQTANGTNGFASPGYSSIGDPGQRMSCPPYPLPLRGLQIKIRVYEPGTRQVRETTIVENFVPD